MPLHIKQLHNEASIRSTLLSKLFRESWLSMRDIYFAYHHSQKNVISCISWFQHNMLQCRISYSSFSPKHMLNNCNHEIKKWCISRSCKCGTSPFSSPALMFTTTLNAIHRLCQQPCDTFSRISALFTSPVKITNFYNLRYNRMH